LATLKHTVSVAKRLPKARAMMVRRNLTDRKLKRLKRDRSLEDKLGHYDTWDTVVPGLGVRVSKTGRRTFVLMTRYPGDRHPARRKLGVYGELNLEQAREKARGWLELIREGTDPVVAEEEARQAVLRLQANTFASVAEDYLALQVIGPDLEKPRQRKAAEVARDFRGVFIALWDERPVTSISRHDVLGLIEGVRDNGTAATLAVHGKGKKGKAEKAPAPGQARNLLGLLKTFFSWTIERGTYGLNSSPCEHLKAARIIGERQADDRTLTDDELLAFWEATGDLGYPSGRIYRLLLLSGLRLNEVADAAWEEFDLAKGIWTIPAARMKGKNGKARPHTVPLTAGIVEILASLPRFPHGEYLFTTNGGESPVWVSDKVKRRLDAAMLGKLKEGAKEPGKVKLPPWINHDLRRTLRSRLSELRVNADVAEAILAHVNPGIRGVYDRYEFFDEKRDALEMWADQLKTIISLKTKAVAARAIPLVGMGDDGPRASFADRLQRSRGS
jgi:integrase